MYEMLDLATFALQSLLYNNMYYYFDDYARGIGAMHKRARERRVLRRSECVEFRNPRKLLCLHAPFNTSRDTVPLADLDDIEDSPVATVVPSTRILILVQWVIKDPA